MWGIHTCAHAFYYLKPFIRLVIQILQQHSKTQPEVIPKFSCDVSYVNGELHQACGHVMLSTWPKDGHMLSVSCTPLHLCSCSWVFSGSRSTPWPAWFSDVLIFPKFWHLTNLWHDFLSLHDLLWSICSFLLPCSVGLPCERSVANGFYFFPVFLLSLPIISASLSNII